MFDFLHFYSKPQIYRVNYEAKIKNTGDEIKEFSVILPIPPETKYQKLLDQPGFSPRDAKIAREEKFGNSYVTWQLKLLPHEETTVAVRFAVEVMPRKFEGEITKDIKDSNEYVLKTLTYGNPIEGLYTAEEAREKKIVDCGGFDTLLQDELKKKGIESRIVAGFWESGTMHAWLEIGDIPADPSIEYLKRHRRTKKSGRLGFVGSDRIVLSLGSNFGFTDILQNPIITPVDPTITYEKHFHCTRAKRRE